MNNQPTLFDGVRMTMAEAIDLSIAERCVTILK